MPCCWVGGAQRHCASIITDLLHELALQPSRACSPLMLSQAELANKGQLNACTTALICSKLCALASGWRARQQTAHLVLGLGLWRLERAGEDGNSDILQALGHLGVAHVLVQDNAPYQGCVFQLAPHLAIHLCDRYAVIAALWRPLQVVTTAGVAWPDRYWTSCQHILAEDPPQTTSMLWQHERLQLRPLACLNAAFVAPHMQAMVEARGCDIQCLYLGCGDAMLCYG